MGEKDRSRRSTGESRDGTGLAFGHL